MQPRGKHLLVRVDGFQSRRALVYRIKLRARVKITSKEIPNYVTQACYEAAAPRLW